MKTPLRFDASDGTILATPKVQAVFRERQLALIKFAHQPKAWLELVDDRPPVGTWVALISTVRDPAPLTGPVLAYRLGSARDETTKPSTQLGFAIGRSPALAQVFAGGVPLMDDAGRAVGVFAGSQPRSAQTLHFASPLDGLGKVIDASLKKPLDLKIPIPGEYHSYEPVRLDPLWDLADQAEMAGNNALALKRIRTLMTRYPESKPLAVVEWNLNLNHAGASSDDSLLEATRRTEPPADADASDRAAYLCRLGEAYCRAGNIAAAMEASRKAFELAPETSHCCGANLAWLHLQRGELAAAESLYRKVIGIVPERIDYLEALEKVLNAKGDWQRADELTPLIYQLEDLYRSR